METQHGCRKVVLGFDFMLFPAKTTLQFFWQDRSVASRFRSGVSLHSHTMYSEESLDMVPRYTTKVPYLRGAIRKQECTYSERKQREFNFANAFWTPPLGPRQAQRLEEKQVQRQFGLPALVSLTDHDDIRAGTLLRVMDRFRGAPISTEWTIPFGPTYFHLGVHNLPANEAPAIAQELARFTARPNPAQLSDLLAQLDALPEVLLVLNHPFWDEKGIGQAEHAHVLGRLIGMYGARFHAYEVNGLRSWHENRKVVALGRETNTPVVSGGDRHGREPNAILNLSGAASLPEFIQEIRQERRSHVVFMPQYSEPLKLRVLQTMLDVVRDYRENPEGRRTWSDRVYYRDPVSGEVLPLSIVWSDGGPQIVKQFLAAVGLLRWPGIRGALRMALEDRSLVWSDQEAAV
jgi:hypothetical protein